MTAEMSTQVCESFNTLSIDFLWQKPDLIAEKFIFSDSKCDKKKMTFLLSLEKHIAAFHFSMTRAEQWNADI